MLSTQRKKKKNIVMILEEEHTYRKERSCKCVVESRTKLIAQLSFMQTENIHI